ncbi:PepSY-associated TM helix domain-containing protein [Chondrinema litorale]|uniref:PepSY-associated TM helix domain-containing protein n=1 Tax=Chondrinema litorale TaxID=2994555 RepID=UPI0025434722|nr:PepSY-associated TM helix domain-containing protein [Chondrinema litorale]UZR99385.1 PepSY-associated TM helix domain-containing protein [Chondrinema litorale]
MNTRQSNSTWKKVRKFFNDVHLWLGIASGLILFVVCLTGTIYTFSSEIQEMLNAEVYEVKNEAGLPRKTEEEIITAVEAELGAKVSSIEIPADAERSLGLNVKKEGKRRGTTYLVDPYTAEIKGTTKGAGSEFFMVMFRLHRWLLLDMNVGRPIVGWATVIFVIILLTGMVIWFPQKVKYWRQGLKIKSNAGWKRINHDLHNALGFYAFILMLVMALTGLQWSFEWYRTGLYDILGVDRSRGRGPKEEKAVNLPEQEVKLSLADYIKKADESLPYEGDYRLNLPQENQASVSVSKYKTGFFAPNGGDELKLNKYTAEVESLEKFSDKPLNEKIARSIKALHVGNVYGTFSKILYFIACLIATSLPVTGTIIWINKLKKKSKRKKSKTLSYSN